MASGQLGLTSVELKGFKSIDREGLEIVLAPVTVMLGANGAGKSNLVSFFKMLNSMTANNLQHYVADQGFADSLLHFGIKTTSEIKARLCFANAEAMHEYSFVLGRDATGRLFVQDETIVLDQSGKETRPAVSLGGGVRESQLCKQSELGEETRRTVHKLLANCRVFQFADTSATAKIRMEGYVDDARYLRSDAGNLAAFLRGLRTRSHWQRYYDRIVRHIRLLVPQFADFDLDPSGENDRYVRLNWREKGSDYLFGPHQLSDGSLRLMALTTLFGQPPDTRPRVIIVDEPELGLHPAAISAIAGMVKAATSATQVILATQSSRLVDEFSADQVLIVERDEQRPRTRIRRLDPEALRDWLERYSLSELWEKNVLGGRP